MSQFQFRIDHVDANSSARAGRWVTPHGVVETPAFMPVGTRGSVKELGGLHAFMGWGGPILTDSGGFQVFSLAELRNMDDDKVVFRSHIDGSLLELTPERAIRIQEDLGADCIMCLDECPPHDVPL